MRVLLELNIEGNLSTDDLKEIGRRAMTAISGSGPKVQPRVLVEMSPNYLEISLTDSHSKHHAVQES